MQNTPKYNAVRRLSQKQIESWGGGDVYREGERLLERGLVMRADWNDDTVEGTLMRSTGELRTRFKILPNGRIENLCPCYTNKEQGLVCPHVTAVAIALLKRQTDPQREQKYQEEQRAARRASEIPEEFFVRRNPRGTHRDVRVYLPTTWMADLFTGNVILHCGFDRGNGELLPLNHFGKNDATALSPADDAIVSVLEDIAASAPPEFLPVKPADLIALIPLLAKKGIQLQDPSGRVADLPFLPQPLTPVLDVTLNETTGEFTLALNIQEVEDLPLFAACHNQGYVQLQTPSGPVLHPLGAILPLPYHPLYQAPIIIQRADMLRFLKSELPSLQALLPVRMTVSPDLFSIIPGKPTFHLTCRGSPASIAVELNACYGDHLIPCAAPDSAAFTLALPDPSDVLTYLTRNTPAEAAALRRINAAGFHGPTGATLEPITGTRAVLNFLGSDHPALRRLGWRITTQGSLRSFHESLPMATPVVSVTDNPAPRSSFEIGMDLEAPDGTPIPQADVQRALMRNDAYLQLGDTTVLFDRHAVLDMRDVFTDCPSRDGTRAGRFRIPDTYAPYVRASLAAIDGVDIEEPPSWQTRACRQNRDLRLTPIPLGPLDPILRPYQKEGVYWLHFLQQTGTAGILADEMGLGKTLQTLTWLSLPPPDPDAPRHPALIICPTSLLENWAREAAHFTPDLTVLLITGPDRAPLFPLIPTVHIVITSYALLRRDLDNYLKFTFSATILDEAQHIKNPTTLNAQAAKKIPSLTRLVLTGTPIENSVADLWSIMDFLMPGYLGPRPAFRQDYELPISRGDDTAPAIQLKLRRKLHPFLLRRLKADVAKDLPAKIQKISYCTLTPDQQRIYDTTLQESRRQLSALVQEQGFNKSRIQILATLMRLRQICCDLRLLKNNPEAHRAENPSAKLLHLQELLDEALDGGHRILLFSQFTSMLHLIESTLKDRNLPYCYLDGSTKDRHAQVQRFNTTPSIPIFLISLTAGGTGLNLTGADTVIHFDPWWNPAVENQATDRAHRIGQKRTVYALKLITLHTIEEKVLQLQQKKQALIDATLTSDDPTLLQSLSWDDIQQLLS